MMTLFQIVPFVPGRHPDQAECREAQTKQGTQQQRRLVGAGHRVKR